MSRITKTFSNLSAQGRKALIPFITAGDPDPELTVPLMHALVHAGADIIELGVPFSDPMADGPVIQRASERALAKKMNLRGVLRIVSSFRQQDNQTPVVLMGYLNPIEVLGYEVFAKAAGESGVDGVLTVDMPPEEAEEMLPLLAEHNVAPIFLLAPNSTDERIAKMSAVGQGYLYYVSLRGVTGASNLNVQEVETKLAQIKALTELPICVGFGVKDAAMATLLANKADGVVVGSALISIIESNQNDHEKAAQEIDKLVRSMRSGMDGVS
ncbi:MAG: tryptophan synthase subunit alpha [Methylococcaceae bacterium]